MKQTRNRLTAVLLSIFMCFSNIAFPVYAEGNEEGLQNEPSEQTEVITETETEGEEQPAASEAEPEETEEQPAQQEAPAETAEEEPASGPEAELFADGDTPAEGTWTLKLNLNAEDDVSFERETEYTFSLSEECITLPDIWPSRDGYSFSGWSVNPDDSEAMVYWPADEISSSSYPAEGETLTLYAVWNEVRPFQVFYHFNEEGARFEWMSEPEDPLLNRGSFQKADIFIYEQPIARGKLFLGWTDVEGSSEPLSIEELTEKYWDVGQGSQVTIHLYAIWESAQEYQLAYPSGDDASFTVLGDNEPGYISQTLYAGENGMPGEGCDKHFRRLKPTKKEDDGTVFKCWKLKNSEGEAYFYPGQEINLNEIEPYGETREDGICYVNFEPVWGAGTPYTLTFHMNGGSFVQFHDYAIVQAGEDTCTTTFTQFDLNYMKLPTAEPGDVDDWIIEKNGSAFLGWALEDGGSAIASPILNQWDYFGGNEIGDLELYAVWEEKDFNIYYHANMDGAEPDGEPFTEYNYVRRTVKAGSDVRLDVQMVHPDYEFRGWALNYSNASSGKVDFEPDADLGTYFLTHDSELNLYAVWGPRDNPIKSVSAESFTLLEGDTRFNGRSNDGVAWYDYDLYPDTVTVELDSGETYSGIQYEVIEKVNEKTGLGLSFGTSVDPDYTQGIGEYPCTLSVMNFNHTISYGNGEYTISVIGNPVESVTAEDITLTEGQDSIMGIGMNGETYDYYDVSPVITVKLTDGTEKTMKMPAAKAWLSEETGARVNAQAITDQTPENPWGPGEHEATVRFGGKEAAFTVTVAEAPESPVVSVTAEPITLTEGENLSSRWSADGNYYMCYFFTPKVTVKLKDRKTFTGDPWEVSDKISAHVGFNIHAELWDDQTAENQWGPGEHEATVRIGGVEAPVKVTILEGPIASVTAQDVILFEGLSALEAEDWQGNPYNFYNVSPVVTVKLKDGTTETGYAYEVIRRLNERFDAEFSYELRNNQPDHHWELGEYEVSLHLAGKTTPVRVTVIENPVERIEVLDEEVICYKGDTYEEMDDEGRTYPVYSPVPQNILVVTTDGNEYSGSPESVVQQLKRDYGGTARWRVRSDQSADNVWDIGEHTAAFALGTVLEAPFAVTVAASPIKSVTVPDQTIYEDWEKDFDGYYNILPKTITVKTAKKTYKGSVQTVAESVAEEIGISKENAMGMTSCYSPNNGYITAGKTYTGEFTFFGFKKSYKFKVVKNPVSFSIDEFKIIDTDIDRKYGDYLITPKAMTVKVGTKTYKGSFFTVKQALQKEQGMQFGIPVLEGETLPLGYHNRALSVYSTKYSHLADGNTLGRMEVPYRFEVIENPIESIEVEPVTIKQGKNRAMYSYGDASCTRDDLINFLRFSCKTKGMDEPFTTTLPELNAYLLENYGAQVVYSYLDETGGLGMNLSIAGVEDDFEAVSAEEVDIVPVSMGKSITLKSSLKKPKWTSSDTSTVKVASSGKVTGLKEGLAEITAVKGEETETFYVEVFPATTGVEIFNDGEAVTKKTLKLDENIVSLSASTLPELSSQSVKWTSSNKKIATVDENGTVTRVKNGTVTITAAAQDGSGKKATVKLQFVTYVTGLEITGPAEVGLKKKVTLKADFDPENPTVKTVTWTSSDKSVATVTAKGVVTGVSEGTATITAVAKDRNEVLDTFDVTVKPAATAVSISLGEDVVTGKTTKLDADTVQLTSEVSSESASQAVKWTSANPKIAEVDGTGIVTRLKNGTVKITAAAMDGSGKKAVTTIKFVTYLTDVHPEGADEVAKGKTITLKAVPNEGAVIKVLSWASDNTDVATVTAKGVVKGVSEGTAHITVTVQDTNKAGEEGKITSESFTVTVRPLSTSVEIKYENQIISKKTTEITEPSVQLTAATEPDNAIQNVTWKSSNTRIAKVDAKTGLVTKVKNGTVTITATAADGSGKKTTAILKFVNP